MSHEKRIENEAKIKMIQERLENEIKKSKSLLVQLENERKRYELNFKRKPKQYNYQKNTFTSPQPLREVTNNQRVSVPLSKVEEIHKKEIEKVKPTKPVEIVKKDLKSDENIIAQRLETSEKHQLEHVSRPKQKKKPPSRNGNISNVLKEAENQTDVAPPTKNSFEELEKKSKQENLEKVQVKTESKTEEKPWSKPEQKTDPKTEVKKPVTGGVNMFGGFQPGNVQLKKVESFQDSPKPETKQDTKTETKSDVKKPIGGVNPFGGFQPGSFQLRKTDSPK